MNQINSIFPVQNLSCTNWKLEIGIIKLAKIKLVCITYELFSIIYELFTRFYDN